MKQKKVLKKVVRGLPKNLQHINVHAAGIDIGSRSHFVAVPEGIDEMPVREFSSFTGDLEQMRLVDFLWSYDGRNGVYWYLLDTGV